MSDCAAAAKECAFSYIHHNLYLSDWEASLNVDALKKERIGCIICINEKNKPDSTLEAYEKNGITHHFYGLADDASEPIAAIFDSSERIIAAELKKIEPRGVLVHCSDGLSRSPTIVANFLLRHPNAKYGGADAQRVVQFIQLQRPLVWINKGFRKALLEVENSIKEAALRIAKQQHKDMPEFSSAELSSVSIPLASTEASSCATAASDHCLDRAAAAPFALAEVVAIAAQLLKPPATTAAPVGESEGSVEQATSAVLNASGPGSTPSTLFASETRTLAVFKQLKEAIQGSWSGWERCLVILVDALDAYEASTDVVCRIMKETGLVKEVVAALKGARDAPESQYALYTFLLRCSCHRGTECDLAVDAGPFRRPRPSSCALRRLWI